MSRYFGYFYDSFLSMNILLNQIQTVGPEGNKILWVLLVLGVIILLAILFRKNARIHFPNFSRKVSITLEKNQIYHPTVVNFTIFNDDRKAIVIQNPVLRFRKGKRTKAYRITSVRTKDIYPLYLEPNKTHSLPVSLQPFYDHHKQLKRFSRLRVEFRYNNRFKSSRYVLLKPTLFRKER